MAVLAAAAAIGAAAANARPAATPTLSVSARSVAFGTTLELQGTVPGAGAGAEVQILSRACGFSGPIPVGVAKTTAGGKYTYAVQPMLNSVFSAQVGDASSQAVPVHISPTVQLRRIDARRFGVDVSAGNGSWFTKQVLLQRLDTRSKRWKKLAAGTLKANSDPGALVSVSSATITARVTRGTELRATLPQATVGACYLAATSPPLTG